MDDMPDAVTLQRKIWRAGAAIFGREAIPCLLDELAAAEARIAELEYLDTWAHHKGLNMKSEGGVSDLPGYEVREVDGPEDWDAEIVVALTRDDLKRLKRGEWKSRVIGWRRNGPAVRVHVGMDRKITVGWFDSPRSEYGDGCDWQHRASLKRSNVLGRWLAALRRLGVGDGDELS